jgi:hypothetical protein
VYLGLLIKGSFFGLGLFTIWGDKKCVQNHVAGSTVKRSYLEGR